VTHSLPHSVTAVIHRPVLTSTSWRHIHARCSYDAVYVVYFKTNARILRADCPNLVAFCIDVAAAVGGDGGCSVSASLPITRAAFILLIATI
jgi:hypothetical protein